VLLVTAPFTLFPVFVLLQILSLASAVLFSIAYFETRQRVGHVSLKPLVLCIVLVYGLTMYVSLALTALQPALTYESLFAGGATGYELRFRGVFSKSGEMGAASGLLIGLAALGVKRWPLKLLLIMPGLACLVLTQSRSFWIAAFIAGEVTAWIYYPRLRKWIFACFCLAMLTAAVSIAFHFKVDAEGVDTFARSDSVGTLTGRTALWQAAFKGWSERPWLGYGFTLGGSVIDDDRSLSTVTDPTQLSRQTLHNGYIQSLMDAGLIGFCCYALTILIALSGVIRHDSKRRFPEAMYVLLFLSIANCGESVVYSGSVFPSLCFWVFAVFAMSLKACDHGAENVEQSEASSKKPIAVPPPSNLMR
jgi:O-antigen ligase